MSLLRVHLLGGLTISWDDQPLPTIPGAAARSLFAYLVTHRDRPQTRDLLAGTFWPDQPDEIARRRLSQALWQIRRALAPHPILLTEGDAVRLNPDLLFWLDVHDFVVKAQGPKPKAQSSGPEIGRGVWGLGLGSLLDAVALYRGDFLAGYYDDWALAERERLREMFLAVLERLVGALKAQGAYEQALTYARRLAAEDSLREEAHREVMRLCHLLGRDGEALQQYQVCRRVLADELGAEPSAGTVALVNEIAAQARAAEVPHLPVASRPSPLALLDRPDQVPLVGRQAERAELARCLELAMAGTGGMVLLAGPAGIGKTRLVQEVARDAAWRGVRVAWGHSCELSAPSPYQPLVEALHGADLAHLPKVWRQELGRLIPELSPPPTLGPEHERGRLLEALARAFLALGQAVPHLVILEDMHWMDPASFEALRVLLPRLPTSRLLVVGTIRPEDLAGQPAARRSLAALEATRIPRRLNLVPLTEPETGALIQRVLDLSQPAPRFSRRLHAQTEGNPFFVTETLQALVDQELLYRDEVGAWQTPWDDATEDYAELPVPPSIAQIVEQRLARLTPAARHLLGVAAVIGRRAEFDLWRTAGERDEETTLAVAEDLARRGLLAEMDDALGYGFTHDTIRQVVYDGLSPARRRLVHRRVAAALESLHPDEVEALARHYRLGQDWPPAMRYALQAGDQAQAVYANQQALDHYRRADAWLAEGRTDWPADEVARWRAELAERQGQVHSLVGEYAAADAAFARARQAWAGLGDWRGEARVLNQWSFLCFIQDDYAGASRLAEQALAVLPENDPPADLWAASLTHRGLSAWAQGRYDDALSSLEKALVLFETIGTDPYGLARCLNSLGLVHLMRGDLDRADYCFARSLALRQQTGDRRGEAWCRHNQARVALARGDLAAARERLEIAQAIFAEIQHPYGLDTYARTLAQLEQAEQAARGARPACPERSRRGTVRLPRADAPTGRPLRDDEYVDVTWTVAAPADDEFADKVKRRQFQLSRLLAQAAEQGAAPTVDDLAAALGASRATIKRDLAALRQAGHDVKTRGSPK